MGVKRTVIRAQRPIDPLISVIIPTYDRRTLLLRAIESALRQTYSNLEIIVVDDASLEDVRPVIESIGDPRILYLRQDAHRGGAAARNAGIRAAAGKYIAFLDDDDEWEPDKLAVQSVVLDQFDAVLCMSTVGSDRNVAQLVRKKICDLDQLRKGMPPVGGTSALMARRDLLKETLFDEQLPRCQDWDLLIRLANRGTIGFVGRRLVRYNSGNHFRITNAAVKVDLPEEEAEKRLAFFEKHKGFFGSWWYRVHVSRALLEGLRHRKLPVRHVLDSITRCGVIPVICALARRLYQKLSGTV